MSLTVAFEPLVDFVARLFAAEGCDAHEARAVAFGLAEANLVGHDSHGVLRVPIYVADIRSGVVARGRRPIVVAETAAGATLDGQQGLGQVAGEELVALGVRKARDGGVATIALRNVGHLGRIGRWAELAADQGLVSLHFVNTSGGRDADVLLVAPFGGADRRMSVNPLAIGVPRADAPPIVMDATMAATAGGKVMAAFNRGDQLPPGQIIDRDGHPSTEPKDLFAGGAILPFGDHRGYALSFMIDVLAGAFSGGGCSALPRHPRMNNMTSIFMDPARFAGAGFLADVEAYSAWMTSAPPTTPGSAVLLPGDVERRTATRRRAEGIPLDDTTMGQLNDLAARSGIAPLVG